MSERPAQATKRSDPLPSCSRGGGRHPGLWGRRQPSRVGARARASVGSFKRACGTLPSRAAHRRQRVSSGRTRRGTSSAYVKRTHSTPTGMPAMVAPAARGHVLRSVPETRARQTLLNSSRSKAERGSAIDSVSRSGKPGQPGRTGTGVGSNGRRRGLPRVTASQEEGVMRKKRKRITVLVPARRREPEVWLPVRRHAVAEVVRRCRVPNTHARSAPKRVAVRVNGGLARRGDRRESVGSRVE